MGVTRFRDIAEMKRSRPRPVGAERFAVWRHIWLVSDRICPLSFPPGVYKHKSIEDAEALRRQWERANFLAHRKRMSGPKLP
jgi:hypothetical protein